MDLKLESKTVITLILLLAGDIETNPGPLPELTLRNLTIELKGLTDPAQFGIGLGFSESAMEIIKKDNPCDTNGQKYALFSKISHNYRSMGITWEKIADVLDDFVDDQNLALAIRKKFGKVEKTVDQRIDEIAVYIGVDPKTLDQECDENLLLPISKLLEHWSSYGEFLGLSAQEVCGIEGNVTLSGFHMRPLEMLRRWQSKKAYTKEAHYRHLLRGCIKIHENAKIVGEICKLVSSVL